MIRFLILLLLLCSSSMAQFLNVHSSSNHVRNIHIYGNRVVDESLIRARLSIQEGKDYHPSVIRDKVSESIRALHQSNLFDDVKIEAEYNAHELDFSLHVTEKPTLLEYVLEGYDDLIEEDLKEKVKLFPGQVFGVADVERNRQALITHYRSEGYLLVDIAYNMEIDAETGKTRVVFIIREGQKVEVAEIFIEGNKTLDSEGIISSMQSEVARWYNDGEYREEVFQSDKDSVLKHYRSFGYLDAQILEARTEYIPDESYHFYNGQFTPDLETGVLLLQTLNADLKQSGHPFTKLARKATKQTDPYYRRFRSSPEQGVYIAPILTEEEAVTLFNSFLDLENLRLSIIENFENSKNLKDPQITKLIKKKNRSESDERQIVRLLLESYYPVLKYREVNTSSKVRLVVKVEEGRQFYVGNFVFLGNKVIVDPVLQSRISLDSGDVFNDTKYQEMVQSFYGLYREDGYLFVRVEPQKEYKDSVVSVSFQIEEGLPAHIRMVHIKGNTTTKDKVVRREVKLFPGDTYRQSLMERSFRDIMQLNYFDNAVPDVKMIGGQEVDLVFDVQEREAGTGQFTAGMAYSGAQGLVGTLGLSIPNCCLGDGQKADLNVQYGVNKQDYSIGFQEPWFADRPIRVGGSINYSLYKYSNQAEILRRGFRIFTGTRLTWPDDYFYIQGDYSFQHNRQGANQEGLVLNTGYESAFGVSITRDDKNLPIFPTSGSRITLSVQKALPGTIRPVVESITGQEEDFFNFWKTDLNMKWWFPLLGKFSLGLDNRLGVISGSKIQNRTLYRMGGLLGYQGKMRGYATGGIGANKLGRSYYNFTSEIVYPVAENRFYLHTFFDAGNVYGNKYDSSNPPAESELDTPLSEIDLVNLYRDVGFGFRVIIPMLGIIGFDWAWPLDADKFATEYGTFDDGVHMNFVIEQGF